MSNSEGSFRFWRRSFWGEVVTTSSRRYRRELAGLALALVLLIGVVNYLTGWEISLLVFYFLPICLAVAALGWRFGVFTAAASVLTWFLGDFAAGAQYSSLWVACWNALIALMVYVVVVSLLSSLLAAHREMEERIRQRTAALTDEIAERERLERAVLETGERERRAIGRELHDGLGQHLTGTSLVAQALATRLAAENAEAAAESRKIVSLVEQGIEQTRALAKGLLLVEIEREGLADALRELAAATSESFRVACSFRCSGDASFGDAATATHLFRIAQEAVRNTVGHGKAGRIDIELSCKGGNSLLRVRDDGIGLPKEGARGPGLGLRIMAHRAALIGATFEVSVPPGGGTLIACRLAAPSLPP